MKSGLFWRLYSAILAVVLVPVVLFTAILLTVQRNRAQDTYETEVRMQARQVAEYMQQLNQLSLVRSNATIQYLVNEKIADIYNQYDADIWIVDFSSGRLQYIDRSWNTSEGIASEKVQEQLNRILAGNEIRITGLFEQLGDHIVTIGVPWTYSNGQVVGAVLLHIPVDRLTVPLLSGFEYPVEAMNFTITMPSNCVGLSPSFTSIYRQESIESDLKILPITGSQIIGSTKAVMNDREGVTMTMVVPDKMFPTVSSSG